MNPENDPLGADYHITQSKIALGSGGLFGKGFMQGTQAHLNFLPEKQTDFIFTMLGEELGFVGAMALLLLYAIVLGFSLNVARSEEHTSELQSLMRISYAVFCLKKKQTLLHCPTMIMQ